MPAILWLFPQRPGPELAQGALSAGISTDSSDHGSSLVLCISDLLSSSLAQMSSGFTEAPGETSGAANRSSQNLPANRGGGRPSGMQGTDPYLTVRSWVGTGQGQSTAS